MRSSRSTSRKKNNDAKDCVEVFVLFALFRGLFVSITATYREHDARRGSRRESKGEEAEERKRQHGGR